MYKSPCLGSRGNLTPQFSPRPAGGTNSHFFDWEQEEETSQPGGKTGQTVRETNTLVIVEGSPVGTVQPRVFQLHSSLSFSALFSDYLPIWSRGIFVQAIQEITDSGLCPHRQRTWNLPPVGGEKRHEAADLVVANKHRDTHTPTRKERNHSLHTTIHWIQRALGDTGSASFQKRLNAELKIRLNNTRKQAFWR